MATRPTVTIADIDGKPSGSTHPMPDVFKVPIRNDVVQYVESPPTNRTAWLIENRYIYTGMAKNKRQPYAVSEKAGHQTSAESWGTGTDITLDRSDPVPLTPCSHIPP